MSADEISDIGKLELVNVIGFNGSILSGLIVHPDRQHIVYGLGCMVVIEDINSKEQSFLQGHSNSVVCISVSRSGKYVASGQQTHMGYKADILLWDFQTRKSLATFSLHKVKVQSLAFSPDERFLASLGGQDDGCVVVWSMESLQPVCGSPAQHKSAGITECLAYSQTNELVFVTAGENTLRVWELDVENRKVRATECSLGAIKRSIKCLAISLDDSIVFCGTSSGDILAVNMKSCMLSCIGPAKENFSLGVLSIVRLINGDLIVGTGDGTLCQLKLTEKKEGNKVVPKIVKSGSSVQLVGGVSSISLRGQGHQFYVGTDKSHIYRFSLEDFKHELVNTAHYSAVNDIVYPHNCPQLFVTCSFQDVRVFHSESQKELLRINIPNMVCYSVDLFRDGTSIISGWDDSKIRAFYPETGQLMYTINDAHKKGVTAVAATSDCRRIVSGGGEGQVRVWLIEECRASKANQIPHSHGRKAGGQKAAVVYVSHMEAAMKEHANAVSCIRMTKDDTQCVSSSADGTCIIWCLIKYTRKQIMFANTLFRCVCWRPDECQIITSGTDRKIGYWEVFDGSLIRELEGSRSGSVNGMDITTDGEVFVTGGDDKIVKVWRYNEGVVTHVGLGHSMPISRVRVSPDRRVITTVSEDGSIYFWRFPSQ